MPLRRNRARKFGAELEFSRNVSRDIMYGAVRTAARNHGMSTSHSETPSSWTLKTDCTCGWEITSPALESTRENMELLRNFIIDVKNNIPDDVRPRAINRSCGFHTHIEVGDLNNQQLRNMFRLFQIFEPALLDIQPRSRNGNGYCGSIRNHSLPELGLGGLRNGPTGHSTGVNFGRYSSRRKTIEVRYGSPSLRGRRVTNWIQVLLFIVEHSKISPNLEEQSLGNTRAQDLSNFLRLEETSVDWLNQRKNSLSRWVLRRSEQLEESRQERQRNRENRRQRQTEEELAEAEIRQIEEAQE